MCAFLCSLRPYSLSHKDFYVIRIILYYISAFYINEYISIWIMYLAKIQLIHPYYIHIHIHMCVCVCLTAYTHTFYATYTKHLFVLCMPCWAVCFVLLLHRRSFLFCFDFFRTFFLHIFCFMLCVFCVRVCLQSKQMLLIFNRLHNFLFFFFRSSIYWCKITVYYFDSIDTYILYMYLLCSKGKLYAHTQARTNIEAFYWCSHFIFIETLSQHKCKMSDLSKWICNDAIIPINNKKRID